MVEVVGGPGSNATSFEQMPLRSNRWRTRMRPKTRPWYLDRLGKLERYRRQIYSLTLCVTHETCETYEMKRDGTDNKSTPLLCARSLRPAALSSPHLVLTPGASSQSHHTLLVSQFGQSPLGASHRVTSVRSTRESPTLWLGLLTVLEWPKDLSVSRYQSLSAVASRYQPLPAATSRYQPLRAVTRGC